MSKYQEWAGRPTGTARLVVTLALAGGLVLVGLPLGLLAGGRWLDRTLGLPRFADDVAGLVAGVALAATGGAFALWAVVAEARIGRGTPVPLIPTQRLVVVPPFTYCRNPMVLGTVVCYLGVGVGAGSPSTVVLVMLVAALLLGYVKAFEEKELTDRFGADYLEYKRTTPFLIPRIGGPSGR